MNRHFASRLAWLTIVALTAACSDSANTTAPTGVRPVEVFEGGTAATAKASRAPYIANVQLASVYVSVTSGYTPVTVTVTNPGTTAYYNMYLKGEIKPQNKQPALPATAFLAFCPNPNGVIYTGSCTMTNGITGAPPLQPGPATYALRLLQQQSNGNMKVIDSKTVNIILTP